MQMNEEMANYDLNLLYPVGIKNKLPLRLGVIV